MTRPVFDQQITVERATRTSDGQGGAAVTWATVFTLFAAVRDSGGSENSRDGDRIEATGRVLFTIQRIDAVGLLESDRVVWDGVTYNVEHITIASRALYRTLTCTRGKAT